MNQAVAHLHILGSGSIGLLLAAKIVNSFPNAPVTMLLRPHHRKRLRSSVEQPCHILVELQSLVQKPSGRTLVSIPAQIIGENGIGDKPIENVLLCTKAVDAVPALLSIKGQMSDTSNVLILCNGAMAVQHHIKKNHLLRSINTRLGTTYHGAYLRNIDPKNDVYRVVHAGAGQLYTTDHALSSFFRRCDLNGEYIDDDDMKITLWKKLAANCVINPLTAIHQCLNGELLLPSPSLHQQHDVSKQIEQIMQEVVQVAKCELSLHEKINYTSFYDFIYSVIHATKQNKSSMYQDVVLGRKKATEIDFLNGYVVHLGDKYGINTPANNQMCAEISNIVKDFDP